MNLAVISGAFIIKRAGVKMGPVVAVGELRA